MNRLNAVQKILPMIFRLLGVGFICLLVASGTGCQLLVNVVAGSLAAETVKKTGSASTAETDKEVYQPPDPATQSYNYSLFWEKKGQLENAIQEMKKFIKLAPDDPRGPERLQMLEAKLNEERVSDVKR